LRVGLRIFEVSSSHSDTAHKSGILWKNEWPVTGTCTVQHTQNTEKRPTFITPRIWNPQSQQASGRIPTS